MKTGTGGPRATPTPSKRPTAHPTKAWMVTTPSARRRPSRARPETDEETRTPPPLQVLLLGSTRPRTPRRHAPLPQATSHDALSRRLLRARHADDAASGTHAHGAHLGGGLSGGRRG